MGEEQPAESGRFLKPMVGNEAYYGMRTSNRRDGMQDGRRYYSQKYNQGHVGNYAKTTKDVIEGRRAEEYRGPAILRTINSKHMHEHDPDIVRQNKIIADVLSPDYHQPTWVLDYRYLKTGGRDYTLGPGGQVLILPKNVRTDEKKAFRDYDSLLEHLRLRNMAQKVHYH